MNIRFLKLVFDALNRRQKYIIALLFPLVILMSLLDGAAIAAVIPFLSAIDPETVGQDFAVVDDFFGFLGLEERKEKILFMSFLVLGLFICKNALRLLFTWLRAYIVHDIYLTLVRRLIATYLRQPYQFHLQRSGAHLARTVTTDANSISSTFIGPLLLIFSEVSTLVVAFIVLFSVSPQLTLFTISIVALAGLLVLRVTRRRLTRFGNIAREGHGEMLRWVSQALMGIKDVKILGSEQYVSDKISDNADRYSQGARNSSVYQAIAPILIETLAISSVISFALFAVFVDNETVSVLAILSVFAVAALKAVPGYGRIVSGIQLLHFQSPVIEGVLKDLRLPLERDHSMDSDNEPVLASDRPLLSFENVSFRYSGTQSDVLNGVSLDIFPGQRLGIVGKTGSGKTTLMNLMIGLLEPTSGRLLLHGEEKKLLSRRWLRSIGHVPQDIFLIDDSLRRNIAFGQSDADVDEERLSLVLELSQLEEFVDRLPDGLDTVVGERGTRLSGGQRQRVAIARAIYADPEILLLDEATSALDGKTERAFNNCLNALSDEKTVVTIAHNLETVKNCDKIVFVDDGTVKNVGTFDELIENSLEFRAFLSEDDADHIAVNQHQTDYPLEESRG